MMSLEAEDKRGVDKEKPRSSSEAALSTSPHGMDEKSRTLQTAIQQDPRAPAVELAPNRSTSIHTRSGKKL